MNYFYILNSSSIGRHLNDERDGDKADSSGKEQPARLGDGPLDLAVVDEHSGELGHALDGHAWRGQLSEW